MKKLAASFLSILIVSAIAGYASADEFNVLGPRAMGMGGAGVAVAHGSLDQYWNPGGLAQDENISGLQIPFDIQGQFNGSTITGANGLFNTVSLCNSKPSAAGCSQAALRSDLAQFGSGNALIDLGAMVGIKIGAFQLGIIDESEVGAQPIGDTTDTVTPKENPQCSGQLGPIPANCFQNNNSSLNLRAGSFTSANLSYAHSFFIPGLTVGATIKAIYGVLGFQQFNVSQNQAGSTSAFKNLNQDSAHSVAGSFDLGALWDLSKAVPALPMHPIVGIVGRNLNNPQFTNSASAIAAGDPAKYTLDHQIRAGLQFSPFHWWHFAADMDLNKNNTFVPGLTSQMAGGGTEINVFNRSWINIPLRAGVAEAVNLPGSKPLYTAGVGLNFLHLTVDLGGQVSSQKVTTTGTTQVPVGAGASLQVGIVF